jgi:hypothetical protein
VTVLREQVVLLAKLCVCVFFNVVHLWAIGGLVFFWPRGGGLVVDSLACLSGLRGFVGIYLPVV